MTSKEYRNNPLFLRNSYTTEGKYGFSVIKKQPINLENIKLLSCSDTKSNESQYYKKYGVHFFVDDYRFESIYQHPEKSLQKYSQYAFLLTPDFSLYAEMPQWRQIESIGKSRWMGAYWQSNNITVVPTISWSMQRSFDYSFSAVEQECVIAISMIGCKQSKRAFMIGYDEMLKRINPTAIICFGQPYKEMSGNIIVIDYKSSREKKRG